MRTAIFVPFDRLSRAHGALAGITEASTEIVFIESESLLRSRTWSAQRLFFLISAAAHLAEDLRTEGLTVHWRRERSLRSGITSFMSENPGVRMLATQPSSLASERMLTDCGITLVPDDSFLTSREDFTAWAQGRGNLLMETFYRWQRTRLGILVEGTSPTGGQWNFDKENRLPPPRGEHPWPQPLLHETDALDQQVWTSILERDLPVAGAAPDGTWATTRSGALRQLDHFLDSALAGFGPYEDAMPADSWSVNHSLLSPYLNIGLLSPHEVAAALLKSYETGRIPLASAEGFLRQLIGWREYVNGLYWHLGEQYRHGNVLSSHRALLPLFEDPQRTSMSCVKSVVADVLERGWTHHIPRLMVLANLALLSGVEPIAFLDWMKAMFVDASDWVMVPNVIGMGLHADGGVMMTKPYAAGGAYVNRMGRYCKGCAYSPTKRTGDQACPLTTLYWDFLDRNADRLGGNQRMAQQFAGLRRLDDIEQVRERAIEVLTGLAEGRI